MIKSQKIISENYSAHKLRRNRNKTKTTSPSKQ